MESIFATQNILFTSALMLMLGLALLEGLSMLLGFGLSDMLDNVLPDFDVPDVETASVGAVTKAFSWIGFGGVPAIIAMVVFLLFFGASGLVIQIVVASFLGGFAPEIIAVPLAFLISLPLVRSVNFSLATLLGNSETSAISREGFIGQVATITLGVAAQGSPAEAKFTDQHGTTHYVMVEPIENERFTQGQTVLIVGPEDIKAATFQVVEFNKDPILN